MNLESTTVVIEPRSLGSCLDLAVVFQRRHARALLPITLAFAGMGGLLAWLLASYLDMGLVWSALWFFTVSPVLGGLLVMGSGHVVFGEPFAPMKALRAPGSGLGSFLAAVFVTRVVILLGSCLTLGLGGLGVAVYYSFLTEVILLEGLRGEHARRRLSGLVSRHYLDLFGRATALSLFTAAAALTVFVLIDQGATLVFDWPIFLGRLDPRAPVQDAGRLLAADPLVVSLLAFASWLVYPPARLAWFFCYLDVRTRKEAWDLELEFRVEARRMATMA